jgi:hypothetical protein
MVARRPDHRSGRRGPPAWRMRARSAAGSADSSPPRRSLPRRPPCPVPVAPVQRRARHAAAGDAGDAQGGDRVGAGAQGRARLRPARPQALHGACVGAPGGGGAALGPAGEAACKARPAAHGRAAESGRKPREQPCSHLHPHNRSRPHHNSRAHLPAPSKRCLAPPLPPQNAIENSLTYDRCLKLSGDARADCQLDKAMANVGGFGARGRGARVGRGRRVGSAEAAVAAPLLRGGLNRRQPPRARLVCATPRSSGPWPPPGAPAHGHP